MNIDFIYDPLGKALVRFVRVRGSHPKLVPKCSCACNERSAIVPTKENTSFYFLRISRCCPLASPVSCCLSHKLESPRTERRRSRLGRSHFKFDTCIRIYRFGLFCLIVLELAHVPRFPVFHFSCPLHLPLNFS